MAVLLYDPWILSGCIHYNIISTYFIHNMSGILKTISRPIGSLMTLYHTVTDKLVSEFEEEAVALSIDPQYKDFPMLLEILQRAGFITHVKKLDNAVYVIILLKADLLVPTAAQCGIKRVNPDTGALETIAPDKTYVLTPAEQLESVWHRLHTVTVTDGLFVDTYKSRGVILDVFPLHNIHHLDELSTSIFSTPQGHDIKLWLHYLLHYPSDQVASYFGPSTGYYFAWLCMYHD